MKFRRTNIAFAVAGAALTAAGATATISVPEITISLVAPAVAAEQTGHDEYIRKNEGTFTRWGRKIDQFNEDAAKKGAKAKQSAQKNLDEAWADVKQRWADLKQAGSDGWQKAKDAYEKSQQKLEEAWRDATS